MVPFEATSIVGAAFKADPFSVYARLRDEAPVCRVALPRREEAFLLTRYADVAALLKDERLVKDPANALDAVQLARQPTPPKVFAPLMRNMLGLDDPDHARLKRLVQAAFTPRRVALLAARTEAVAARLLSAVESKARFDLIADFAMPLPVAVISGLLGVPEPDQRRFAHWSHALIRNTLTPWSLLLSMPAVLAFLRYLRRLIDAKREAPQDDLVSDLVRAEGVDRLSEDELMAMIAILLSAGHETTTNLIGNGTLALLQHPEQWERLRAEPSLVEPAIEELLRYASPVEMSTHRYAREDVEIAGQRIPKGSIVLGAINAGNRDERQFAEPDVLDVGRPRSRHLAFGEGGHHCVGAALARMEGRIAIEMLTTRLPHLGLAEAPDGLRWRPGLVLRGLVGLPVTNRRGGAG